jgi:aspartyl aminopeptidase
MNAEPGVPNSDHNRTRQMPGGNTTEQDALADRLLRFLDASPSPYHAVETAKLLLETAGYTELREDCSWLGRVHPGGRYYTTRNESTIVAFRVGRAFHVDAVNGGELRLVGAHTDSPCFRVKPRSRVSDANYEKVAVECYGGGLWYTWFDRDLKCAGRVIWRCASPTDPAQGTSRSTSWQCTLVHVREPILRIPSLAIHLDREVNQGFAPNRQTHLVPVAATALNRTKLPQCQERHATALMGAVIHTLQQDIMPVKEDPMSITRDAGGIVIHDFDLCLADAQPASIGGVQREFIFASRLDNLFSCFAALEALLSLDSEAGVESGAESAVCMVALFDHEECGSGSAQGAASPLVSDLIRRVLACLWTGKTDAGAFEDAVQYTIRRSFLISLDMAHAVHPNYAEKHESGHQPLLGHGPVLKVNANQRYATDGWSAHLLRAVAECCDSPIPLQEYVVRNDMPCGSTIGPIVAAGTGVRTVDVGAPSLSMHSIREMAHIRDLWYTVKLLQAFMRCFGEVRASHNTACVT